MTGPFPLPRSAFSKWLFLPTAPPGSDREGGQSATFFRIFAGEVLNPNCHM